MSARSSGIITDDSGLPAPNATVTLTRTSVTQVMTESASSLNNDTTWTAKTDANGTYAFYDMVSGEYSLTVTKDGYSTATSNVSLTSEGIATGGVTLSGVMRRPEPISKQHIGDLDRGSSHDSGRDTVGRPSCIQKTQEELTEGIAFGQHKDAVGEVQGCAKKPFLRC